MSSLANFERSAFGQLPGGEVVEAFTLRNANGIELRAMAYGAAILSIRVPDRDGRFDDVVLGYDDLAGYMDDKAYLGVVAGRYANRIREGRFTLDGQVYTLATNDGSNHLHGGVRGLNKRLWRVAPFRSAEGAGLMLAYTSPDGEEGYPGTVEAWTTYTLTDRDELVIDYRAITDRPTVINLTQHAYFNLTGDPGRDVLGHDIEINASRFTPVDPTLIPTGELAPVAGTPLDFTRRTAIGARIDAEDVQLRRAGGYDHNWVLNGGGGELAFAARAVEPTSGRTLEVRTTEPGIQFYSGNFLDGTITGKGGQRYERRTGFCLETQHFPDSPNQPAFPSTVLEPDQEYTSRTVYRFGTEQTAPAW